MCGIVGYAGKRNALPILIDGLERLEYRGYDSAGVAFQNGGGIEIFKTQGKINDLRQIMPAPLPHAHTGLGHTRWATHGVPCTRNAHPHSADNVVVVHNGIIENYRELRAMLADQGHTFFSETDTEVIPHMIAQYVRSGLSLRESIRTTMSHLRGTFALGIMSGAEPGVLFAVRRGSPLVVALGADEHFFASDIPAVLPYARKVVFLDDGEICTLTKDSIEVSSSGAAEDAGSVSIGNRVVEIDWTPSMAEKEGHPHFMLKEIFEQPRTVAATFSEWLRRPQRLLDACRLTPEAATRLKRLQIVACGTSYHAALVGKYLIEGLSHLPVDVDIASEYRYKQLFVDKGALFVSITQSGETADTLAAQREAKRLGAHTLTICNVVGSTSSREADAVLYTRAGPEIGVASTKAFTAQVTLLSLLALTLGITRGTLRHHEWDVIPSRLEQIPRLIDHLLKASDALRDLAGLVFRSDHFLYLGRGINCPIALEGALKLKEISYIHAEGYPAGEMKHGPIALIEDGLPVVAIAPGDGLMEKMFSNIEEVKARGGRVIVVSDRPEFFADKVDHIIEVPEAYPALSPFLTVVPLQLLAYHIAVLRGCDVDQPRNLAKSVTVE